MGNIFPGYWVHHMKRQLCWSEVQKNEKEDKIKVKLVFKKIGIDSCVQEKKQFKMLP